MRREPDDRRGAVPGSGSAGPGPGRSGLQPTKVANLIVSALVTAAVAWLVMKQYFADIPNVTWLAGLTLAGLAVVEGIAAHNTKARIDQRPRSGALNPLFIARLAVLAKASSLAGAIFAGAYGGVAAWALSERGQLNVADANLPPSIGGLVGSLALVAAALLLERSCRVPDPPDDEDPPAVPGPGPSARR
jgi:Protein of unknown function (DUF3180)